ncbi:hypothetical protein B566_EDAN013800, partial [Ephemera danica]
MEAEGVEDTRDNNLEREMNGDKMGVQLALEWLLEVEEVVLPFSFYVHSPGEEGVGNNMDGVVAGWFLPRSHSILLRHKVALHKAEGNGVWDTSVWGTYGVQEVQLWWLVELSPESSVALTAIFGATRAMAHDVVSVHTYRTMERFCPAQPQERDQKLQVGTACRLDYKKPQMLVCAVLLLTALSTVSARLYLIELDDDHVHQAAARVRRSAHHEGVTGPVHTYVKTDKHANFKWGVKHHVGKEYA